jgi:hypothetical protein
MFRKTNFNMAKVVTALLDDALSHLKDPEVQDSIQSKIVQPLLAKLLDILYPYLLGIGILWGILFLCIVLILLILIQGGHGGGIPFLVLGKQQVL